jgi:ATP phosphoribosyltransferase
MDNLRIGLPSKGRLAEDAADLLVQAGLKFHRQERSLFSRVSQLPVDIIFLRTDDIPVLCAEGAIDLGITGSDLVEEAGVDLKKRLALDFGKCRLSVCVPENSDYKNTSDIKNKRIATSFSRLTKNYFSNLGADIHLLPVSGSVEIMISLGVADAIVDVVQTGSTLAANGLRILADIGKYETMLFQNSKNRYPDIADLVVRRIEGIVIARSWSLLEYNIKRSLLPEAEKITPGFNSPTISSLEEKDWCAVKVMVPRKELIEVMDKLETMGAAAILETRINNCRL